MAQGDFDPFAMADPADLERALGVARSGDAVTCPYEGVYVVADDAGVREVLADVGSFSNVYNFALQHGPAPSLSDPVGIITRSDPPRHTALRRFLRRWFAPSHLRAREATVRTIVDQVVAELDGSARADLVARVARVVPTRTVYAFIGIPVEAWETLQALADRSNALLPEKSDAVLGEIAGALAEVLERRRASGERRDDIIDALVHPGADAPFAAGEAATHLYQLIAAGTDTTTGLISNLLYRLLEEPRRWQRVVDDPGLIGQAVEESLRRDSPLQYTLRTSTTGGSLGGFQVSARDRIVLSLQSANLDESVWGPTAHDFDLDRDAVAGHAAFAPGIHSCLGAPLARLEARVTIEALVRRFPKMRLADDFVLGYRPNAQVRAVRSLAVELGERPAGGSAGSVTLRVDQARCEGHGLCESVAPDVVHLDEDGFAVVDQPTVPAHLEAVAAQAVRACPVAALRMS